MRLNFKNIHIKNFMSFEDTELTLGDYGYTLVSGVNENPDDLANSNGSGKSSVWEAIAWSLTGETVRGTKDVKRIGSTEECSVELTFDVDTTEYVVIRTKEPSNLKVYINGKDESGKGIRDTQQLLEEYLPDLTSSLIGSVIILGQGLPQRFTNNTPAGRKDVLERLSKSDFMIDDLKRRVAMRKERLESDIRTCEDNILSSTTSLSMLDKQLDDLRTKLSGLVFDTLNDQLTTLNGTLDKLVIDRDNLQVTSMENRINELNSSLSSKRVELSDMQLQINTKYSVDIEKLKAEKTTLETKINILSNEIKKIESNTGICPTCGRPYTDYHKPDTTEQHNELNRYTESIQYTVQKLNELTKSREDELLSCTSVLNASINELNQEISRLSVEYRTAKNTYDNLVVNIDTTTKNKLQIEYEIKNLELTKSNYEKSITDMESQKVAFESQLCYNKQDKDKLENHLSIVNKMSTVISRDFRGYLLTNVIEYINNKAKEYSRVVFDTDKLDFRIDGNNISISYDGKEYENLSGGEKQKVDLIVQLAIRDMLCTYLDFSCNILVVDELFDNLDSIGCNRVLDLIASHIDDVSSIYIVTHHQDISIPVDNEITIVKGVDKISRVRR